MGISQNQSLLRSTGSKTSREEIRGPESSTAASQPKNCNAPRNGPSLLELRRGEALIQVPVFGCKCSRKSSRCVVCFSFAIASFQASNNCYALKVSEVLLLSVHAPKN
uniref:(northern house mosquito) hypothetical protein n=1 Tax=Culex pipiens TaxID=7175 RepID=A0A8D8D207_CULPI